MMFGLETEELTLIAFPSELKAVGYCKGFDVEAEAWLFWSGRG